MVSSPPLELKISPLQIFFYLVVVAGTFIMFLWGFLREMWRTPGSVNAISVVPLIIIVGSIGWCIYAGVRYMWLETGFYLSVDEQKIRVVTRQGDRMVPWEEIYKFTTESRSTTGESGHWLSLRGRDEQVMAQWNRNWCRFTGGQIRRGDEIESFICEKLRTLGRLQDEKKAVAQLWESLHPMSSSIGYTVQTNYGWIGWMTIVLLLPAAFFSWNSSTGGPVVGSGFLAFALMGVYLVSSKATLRVNDERVESTSLYGTFRMEWTEVTRVAIDEQGNSLCFEGMDKRLCFAGPRNCKDSGKKEMFLYLTAQCEKRGVPFDTRSKPTLGLSKNTKVRHKQMGA